MSEDFRVAPMSWDAISSSADDVRRALGLGDTQFIPVMDIIERVMDQQLELLEFRVGDRFHMGNAEGHTCPAGTFIELREDVYAGALAGDGRARFTAAHELGHWILHAKRPLARLKPNERPGAFERSEPQANQFAAEFLMPRQFFRRGDTAATLARRHGVSIHASELRIAFMEKKVRS
jgi:Zn-dependent peptidase ImmA (M78 family)